MAVSAASDTWEEEGLIAGERQIADFGDWMEHDREFLWSNYYAYARVDGVADVIVM